MSRGSHLLKPLRNNSFLRCRLDKWKQVWGSNMPEQAEWPHRHFLAESSALSSYIATLMVTVMFTQWACKQACSAQGLRLALGGGGTEGRRGLLPWRPPELQREAHEQDSWCDLLSVRMNGTRSESPQRNQNSFAGEKYETGVPCFSSLSAEWTLGRLERWQSYPLWGKRCRELAGQVGPGVWAECQQK